MAQKQEEDGESKRYYKRPMKEEDDDPPEVEIEIKGPMTMWITILVIGLVFQFIVAPTASYGSLSSTGSLINSISKYILYLPGAIILPLIVSVWVGEKIGSTKRRVKPAFTAGLLNAIYIALIYAVAIFIIYLLIYYVAPNTLPTGFGINTFATYLIAIPLVILLVLTPLFASLSAARHM